MTQLNVGVVGLGAIGQKHCEVLAQIREAKLLAVADTNAELLNKTAGKFGALPFADAGGVRSQPGGEKVVHPLHGRGLLRRQSAGKCRHRHAQPARCTSRKSGLGPSRTDSRSTCTGQW